MATELYQRVIAFDHGDASRNDVVRKVWDGTPWMIDVFTGKCGDELDRDMREWCMKNLGPEASPIHGQDGEWQRGYAIINGWTWFGFKTEDQMMRFIERFPSTNKGDGGTPPLSKAAQEARRPPAPALLLGADQERPNIPAKARVARAARSSDRSPKGML